ncbi:MAG: hypothetical protein JEZ14_04155 [Marinilabiliaceae bacterium]|nr:hypothetical protein [Marinilabiliaceae bacterium]
MDKLPYDIRIVDEEKKVSFRFSGQLIINYIEKIVEEVTRKVNLKKDLEVVVDNPEVIDVTFIQLILALKYTYNKQDQKMTISSSLSEELKILIVNSGFYNVLN